MLEHYAYIRQYDTKLKQKNKIKNKSGLAYLWDYHFRPLPETAVP